MSAPSGLHPRSLSHAPDILQAGLGARLVQLRHEHLVRKALQRAGEPGLVLDLPCGTGAFWSVLAEKDTRIIVAADQDLRTACTHQDPALVQRITPLPCSALDIDLPDNCVDCIFSMDLLTHATDAMQRMEVLKEFHRVTRETVIVSMRIDGNLSAWRHTRPGRTGAPAIIPRLRAEKEFIAAGFHIQAHLDLLPLCSAWRLYVLRKE